MARTKRKSIYGTEIKEINVSDILTSILEGCFDPDWTFDVRSDWTELLKQKFEKIDFWNVNYISGSASYWCGVLTLEPFHTLTDKIGKEEDILNLIKTEHIQMVEKDGDVILHFSNPTKSPLYRFFNQYKEDGFGGNVTYSVNVLLSKIEKVLKDELEENLSSTYGQWIPYEEEEIA